MSGDINCFFPFLILGQRIALFNTLWIVELQMKGKYDKQDYESAGTEEKKKGTIFFFWTQFCLAHGGS